MELATGPTTEYEAELVRLFYVFRVTQLNLRYYGCRAARFAKRVTVAQAIAATLSGAALGMLSISALDLKLYAGICAAISGLIAATLPSLGWAERSRELYALHLGHKQLFGQIHELVQEIKRDGFVSDRSIGASQVIHDSASRLEMLDEQQVDGKLRSFFEDEVRQAFPPDYLWTSL